MDSVEHAAWTGAGESRIVLHSIVDPRVSRLNRQLAEATRIAVERRVDVAAKLLWRLQWMVLQTIFPFDDKSLQLEDCIKELQRSMRNWSGVDELAQGLQGLISDPCNRKGMVVEQIYCDTELFPISLWLRPRNCESPGCPIEAVDRLSEELGKDRIEPLSGKRAVPDNGALLLITSPWGRDFPGDVAKKLVRHGQWHDVHVLAYDSTWERFDWIRETLRPPGGLQYWKGKWHVEERVHGEHLSASVAYTERLEDLPLSAWEGDDGWGEAEQGIEDPVQAIAIKLAGGGRVAYALDGTVLVLNRVDGHEVMVLDVEPGDLIPVMTNGNLGHALDVAAANRLGGEKKLEMFERECLDWKATVDTCLRERGESKLREAFHRKLGDSSASWNPNAWASTELLGPRSRQSFRALILAVQGFGFFREHQEIEKYIAQRWDGIQHIRGARRTAGRQLNDSLRDKLKEQLTNKSRDWKVNDEISLDGSDRCFRVLKVEAVGSKLFLLHPYHLEKLKPWQT